MFLSLIPDLKNEVLHFLSCKTLTILLLTCKTYQNFIGNNNLIEKKINRGFPRTEGHCMTYYYKDIKYSQYKNIDVLSDKLLEDYDLIRGDLVKRTFQGFTSLNNDDTHIFDGCKIIPLDYSKYLRGHIPKGFTVITNNLSQDYWLNELYCDSICKNYNYINLDIIPIRDQCLNNIKQDGVTKFSQYKHNPSFDEIPYTEFEFNNIKYIILIYPSSPTINQKDIIDFNNYINNNDIIELQTNRSGLFYYEIPNSMWIDI